MKTLVCIRPGEFDYKSEKDPQEEKGNAIVKIRKVGVCGTDLHAFEGTQPYFSYPRILGHELSGEIVSVNPASGFSTAQIVTIIPYFNCGTCKQCRSGKTNCCTSLSVYGVHIDGGMRECVSVPEKFLIDGRGLNLEELALVEPLAIGAHSVRRAEVLPNQHVLVVGIGPIGLGIIEFAKIAGATVTVIDVNEFRMDFCRKNTRADQVLNGKDPNTRGALADITEGAMPDVIFDATGNQAAINNSFNFMSHGGKYVLVGLQKGEISFSHPEFHKREGTLMSSRNATVEDFNYVINCISKKLIDPVKFITHRVQFGEVKENFPSWMQPETGVIKAMINL
jgi:2-desacetyl-2-hydroxyethyl bacteriochlorophyllide A dehydrogenase